MTKGGYVKKINIEIIMSDLISYLFKTNAVNICPENKPFWYTSGKIGPYYINSEFLYGSKEDSSELLEFINEEKGNKFELPRKVFERVQKQYEENEVFRHVIDEMKAQIESNINVEAINSHPNDLTTIYDVTLKIKDKDDLEALIRKLSSRSYIKNIERVKL